MNDYFDQYQKENENNRNQMLKSLQKGETILFVGAGLSTDECPDWCGLIERLETKLMYLDGTFKVDEVLKERDELGYLDYIKEGFLNLKDGREKYLSFLIKIFNKYQPSKILHNLVSLPFAGIITTNYDNKISCALNKIYPDGGYLNKIYYSKDNPTSIRSFFLSINNSQDNSKKVFHIHGNIDYPDSLVVTRNDYENIYGNCLNMPDSLLFRTLWALFSLKKMVFVGFSLQDPFIQKILHIVCRDFWLWDNESHYIIRDISDKTCCERKTEEKIFKDDFGITTIFYDNNDKSYQGIEMLFKEILHKDEMPVEKKGIHEIAVGLSDDSSELVKKVKTTDINKIMKKRVQHD